MSLSRTQTLPPASPLLPTLRPITSAAAETTWIEAAEPFHCTSEVGLSQRLFQIDGSKILHMADTTASVRRFTLDNVVLDSESLEIFQAGALIAETQAGAPAHAGNAPYPAIPLSACATTDVILGANRHHQLYQTWVTQCLPAIDWCLRLQAGRPASLVLPELAPWQQEFLGLLGYDDIPRITLLPRTRYQVARLHFAEFLTGVHTQAVSHTVRRTVERLLAAVPPAAGSDVILYVPGSDHNADAPENEAELIYAFRANGIRVVEPGLALADRINLFRNAHVVIGPSGPGLTDIVFCRPQTLLWEWMPRTRLDASFNRLAQAARIDYLGDVFPTVPIPMAVGSPWRADTDLIRQRMGEIAARLARQAVTLPASSPSLPLAAAVVTPLPPALTPPAEARPADPAQAESAQSEVFARFEALGEDPAFGLVQSRLRKAPCGHLNAANFAGRPRDRLDKLVAALESRFEGIGTPDTVTITPASQASGANLVAYESRYGLRVGIGVHDDTAHHADLGKVVAQQLQLDATTLRNALSAGKIWVWQSATTTDAEQLQPLLRVLREAGPNALLWVCDATLDHPSGRFDVLADDFFRATIRPAAEPGSVPDLEAWRRLCQEAVRWQRQLREAAAAKDVRAGTDPFREPSQAAAAPEAPSGPDGEAASGRSTASSTTTDGRDPGAHATSQGCSPTPGIAPGEADGAATAMEYLTRAVTRTPPQSTIPPSQVRRSLLGRLFSR